MSFKCLILSRRSTASPWSSLDLKTATCQLKIQRKITSVTWSFKCWHVFFLIKVFSWYWKYQFAKSNASQRQKILTVHLQHNWVQSSMKKRVKWPQLKMKVDFKVYLLTTVASVVSVWSIKRRRCSHSCSFLWSWLFSCGSNISLFCFSFVFTDWLNGNQNHARHARNPQFVFSQYLV